MKSLRSICTLIAGFSILSAVALAQQNDAKMAAQREYGRYLVEEVAKCQECHTPKLENGELDKTKWLKGAVMEYGPLKPIADWHKTSPDLTPTGRLWERWKEEGLRNYLLTGLTPRGTKAGPPMPTYKMKAADVDAILVYLKSLPQ
jgi:hypothetical protein